ncbi:MULTISPECIES: hypothetical protein [Cyanophyceae]|uniref:Uncharacterized protein n=1 Tax=Leptolyngbya subtilissima DQ-A4 TaxID=2933933 RepID=A0ABV0K288_9CYAN|nr:hypothetical protein [Nodosilinea sp. FACHB-141]MBD2111676.1 hypothetical protein [Nodosilinea sp. FACHB-141]
MCRGPGLLKPGQEDSLRRLLDAIAANLAATSYFQIAESQRLHFCAWGL